MPVYENPPRLFQQIDIDAEDMKNYLRVQIDADDSALDLETQLINDLIMAAISMIPQLTSRDFQEYDEDLEELVETKLDDGEKAIMRLYVRRAVASWYQSREDDTASSNHGGESVTLGTVPWSAETILAPLKRLPGL